VLWFLITFVPVSFAVALMGLRLDDVLLEHRLYLPGVGLFAAAGAAAAALAGKQSARGCTAVRASVLLLALVLAATAYARNSVWQSSISLWEDAVRKAPSNVRAHNNLGNAYAVAGDYDGAIEHYTSALTLKPSRPVYRHFYAETHYNLALTYWRRGLKDEALRHYGESLALMPGNPDALSNMGLVYFEKGMADTAIEYYTEALRLAPSYANAYFNLGEAFLAKGLMDESIRYYSEYLRYVPGSAEAHNNLARAYRLKGLGDKAAEHARMAREIRDKAR